MAMAMVCNRWHRLTEARLHGGDRGNPSHARGGFVGDQSLAGPVAETESA